jgi:hypothetical protein
MAIGPTQLRAFGPARQAQLQHADAVLQAEIDRRYRPGRPCECTLAAQLADEMTMERLVEIYRDAQYGWARVESRYSSDQRDGDYWTIMLLDDRAAADLATGAYYQR